MDEQDLTDEQLMLHQTTTKFISDEMPIAAVRALHDDPTGYDRKWLSATAALGWYSMLIDEEHGGGSVTGHGLLDLSSIADSVGRYLQPGPFLPMNVVGAAISEFGSTAQRQEFLPKIAAGELVASWAPFNCEGEWDAGAGLAATRDGDHIVLRGSRGLVPEAPSADQILVVCQLDGQPVQILVPANSSGLDVEALTCFDLSRRVGELRFDEVHLPTHAVLGEVGSDGAEQLERELQIAVVLACADTVGALDALFAMTVEYSKQRIAFGRPIGSFQALKHVMADQALYLESCKAAAAEAARVVDARGPDAGEVVSMAAAYLAEYTTHIVQDCLQIHGGIGYTWEHDLHLFMRRTETTTSIWCDKTWHYERLREVVGL